MTSPHHLHATTAAWSLHAARDRLLIAAAVEAHESTLAAAVPRDGLRSTTCGTRGPRGGHGDPVGGIALTTSTTRRTDRHSQLYDRTTGTLAWLARQLDTPGDGLGLDPLALLMTTLPTLRPANAANLAKWLTEMDGRIRGALGIDPDEQLVTGVPCPRCGTRQLYIQTAAPEAVQTVICRAGCVCTGQGCTCGMPGAVEGAQHIWPRGVVLGSP